MITKLRLTPIVRIAFFALSLIVTNSNFAQTKRYVKPGGTGDGSSWTSAGDFQTIINNSNVNDSVFVMRGSYQPVLNASFSMKEGVKIYGSFNGDEANLLQRIIGSMGTDSTILIGNGKSVILNISNNLSQAAILDGFKITGGSAINYGGGIYNDKSSPTISNCSFSGNTVNNGNGGGISNLSSSSPIIINCSFSGNSATGVGGAIFNGSPTFATISNCLFTGNISPKGGAISNQGSPTIANCVFIKNSSSNIGAGIHNDFGSTWVFNCSFWGNSAGNAGGGIYNNAGSPKVKNCILFGNSDGIINITTTATITYCFVQGMAANTTNHNLDGINGNPLFVNATGNLQLLPGSTCLNAGDTTGISKYIPKSDVAGNNRYINTIDMGAYELQPPNPIFVNVNTGSNNNNGNSWATALNSFQLAVAIATKGDTIYVAKGTYQASAGQSFKMADGVKIYGSFAGNETSLAQRVFGNTIADSSVLLGNGNRVFFNPSLTATAVLDGFKITGGVSSSYGGGMSNTSSAPTISNCIFSGNTAGTYGGAIDNYHSSPIISNCIFSGNKATSYGGAISNNGYSILNTPTINNCTFSDNTAISYGGAISNANSYVAINNSTFLRNTSHNYGGAIENISTSPVISNCIFLQNIADTTGGGIDNVANSSPKITNCSFSANTAPQNYGGGIYYTSSCAPKIKNCIIYGNSNGISYGGDLGIITYSLVEGMPANAANHNLDGNTDPLFTDAINSNLQLLPTSPCINQGDSTGVSQYIGNTDLGGMPRYNSDIIDIGAYEYQLITYTFTGNGNWTDAINWLNNIVPPTSLPTGSQIIVAGNATLNTPQTISKGAGITIQSGYKLSIPLNLTIQ